VHAREIELAAQNVVDVVACVCVRTAERKGAGRRLGAAAGADEPAE
jgi:hypothetical protein